MNQPTQKTGLPEDPEAFYGAQWKGWDDFLGLPEGTHALHEQAEALHEKFVSDLKPILQQLAELGAPRPAANTILGIYFRLLTEPGTTLSIKTPE